MPRERMRGPIIGPLVRGRAPVPTLTLASYCTRRGVGLPRGGCGIGTPGRPSQTSMPVLGGLDGRFGCGAGAGGAAAGAGSATAIGASDTGGAGGRGSAGGASGAEAAAGAEAGGGGEGTGAGAETGDERSGSGAAAGRDGSTAAEAAGADFRGAEGIGLLGTLGSTLTRSGAGRERETGALADTGSLGVAGSAAFEVALRLTTVGRIRSSTPF